MMKKVGDPLNKQRILVVEDEKAIQQGLLDVLVFHGYEVDSADDGAMGLRKATSGRYDLVLLDVMLPSVDGFSILEEVRNVDREQPVIMLTARSGDEDVIQGLKLGADDYVSKPFSVTELVLRVAAVLRRRVETDHVPVFNLGHWQIDVLNLSAQADDDEITFTRREMDVLAYLHANHDRPVGREELLSRVWGYDRNAIIETRTVDIHIAKLRRKLEVDTSNPSLIVTVRGAGYRLMSEPCG